jgi:hypothetical protein
VFAIPGVYCKGMGSNGGDLILDPNAPQYGEQAPRFSGRRCMKLADKEIFPLVLFAQPQMNNVGIIFNGTLSDDGTLEGDVTTVTQGLPALENDTTKLIALAQTAFARYGQGMTATESGLRDIGAQRMVCRASGSSKTPLTSNAGGLVKVTLPQTPGGIADMHFSLSKTTRTTPVDLSRPFREGNMVTIHLPQSWTCASVPAMVQKNNDAGELICDVRSENGVLIMKKSLNLFRTRIPADTYEQLRELIDAWLDPAYTTLYLVKTK